MESLGIEEVILQVRTKIDEIQLNESEDVLGTDDSDIDTIIMSNINEAINYVVGNADVSLLEPNASISAGEPNAIVEGNGNEYKVSVSIKDLLRLVSVSAEGWPKSVSETIHSTLPEYAMLSNPYTTGTHERPKVGCRNKKDKTIIELFSVEEKEASWQIDYFKRRQTGDLTSDVEICTNLKDALIYYIAAMTLLAYKDTHADSFFNLALVNMGLQPKS